ncbi:hypothetical protein ABZP36_031157 [Zizania latifolia]
MHRFASASSLPPPPAAVAAAAAARFGSATPRGSRALSLTTVATCAWRRTHMRSSSASAAASAAAAVEEARQGRKQLGATPQIFEYLLANVREHPVRPSALSLCVRVCSVSGKFLPPFRAKSAML